MKPLKGKVAIVTGTSSPVGIGAAVARRLAQSGARLLLAADASSEEVAADCTRLNGEAGSVAALTVDLADAAAVAAVVSEAEARFGGIDLLVNNAAIRINRKFGEFSVAEFDRGVAINLRAPFLASQAVLPSMRRRGGGRIVHIASQLGSVAYQTRTVYGMTKAALIHLAKSMALELAGENIQVNTVSPGPIATQPTLDRMRNEPGESARRLEYVPMGRFGRPEEIGEVVHWLLTTDAGYLTGQDLVVDGGYTIH
jgi:NAD(P)-dependent dehydrogenase (short-subunit alcohol dehydrogenase family)